MKPPERIIRRLRLRCNHASCHHGDVTRIFFSEARKLGEGFFRSAYRVGDWVIKMHGDHMRTGYSLTELKYRLQRAGYRMAPTWRVNGWVVQPYYRRASMADIKRGLDQEHIDYRTHLDLGYGNAGIDKDGRLVAFDW